MSIPYRPSLFCRLLTLRCATPVALLLLVAGCATQRPAPVEERARGAPVPPTATAVPGAIPATPEPDWRPATYVVKRGDTLYQIALDHGLDYKDLAAWNTLENPNLILVGQVLLLQAPGDTSAAARSAAAPGTATTAPLRSAPPVVESRPGATPGQPPPVVASRNADNYKASPKAVKEPYSEQAVKDLQRAPPPEPPVMVASVAPTRTDIRPEAAAPVPRPAATVGSDDDGNVEWIWPTKGKVVSGFSESATLKGLDIAGTAGQPVLASAGGKIVYAGSGLRGYGKLVIIKHNDTFLSAYAHNRELNVKEGQQVTKGQKIAEMGNTDADQVKLHFEIRRLGKPMDPAKYLPPA